MDCLLGLANLEHSEESDNGVERVVLSNWKSRLDGILKA
jgi:hypothetical protein